MKTGPGDRSGHPNQPGWGQPCNFHRGAAVCLVAVPESVPLHPLAKRKVMRGAALAVDQGLAQVDPPLPLGDLAALDVLLCGVDLGVGLREPLQHAHRPGGLHSPHSSL